MNSRLDALIHKASIAIPILTSGRQSALFGVRALDMETACIKSAVWMTILPVRTREASIWKLLAVNVRPSGWQGITVWTRLTNRKDLRRNF
jgi:hypothetical protein